MRRAGLVLDAVVLCALGLPWWIATPAALVAVVAVSERVTRHRRRGPLDAAIVGLVSPLVALLFLGLLLNVFPVGLTRVSWAIGAGVLGLAALACCAGRPVPPTLLTRPRVAPMTLLWGSTAAVIALAALGISVSSARDQEQTPVQLALTTSGGVTRAVVTAGGDAGPFVLRATSGAKQTVLRSDFSVSPGESVSVPVLVADDERVVVTLTNPSQTQAVRSVVLDRRSS